MQLCNSRGAAKCSQGSTRSRKVHDLTVRAQAPLTGNTGGASSNSTATGSVAPLSFERPAGGGSRSFDLPRSIDSSLTFWGPRSDVLRPSGGAARGAVFAAAGGEGNAGIDRPGGRGGRVDMPSSSDTPSGTNPSDPALARPGGRGGRDAGLSSSNTGGISDPALARPGGRGGRDSSLSSIDQPNSTPSIDRPGGRGGREGPSGGDNGGSSGGGGSGGGGSGGDGSDSSSSGGEEGGFNFGKAIGGAALYAGVIAAAWVGHQKLYPPAKEQAAPAVKPCCAGKNKK